MIQGVYEQLINRMTGDKLSGLDDSSFIIGKEKSDVEEERKLRSIYIDMVTRRALKMVREQDGTDEELIMLRFKLAMR